MHGKAWLTQLQFRPFAIKQHAVAQSYLPRECVWRLKRFSFIFWQTAVATAMPNSLHLLPIFDSERLKLSAFERLMCAVKRLSLENIVSLSVSH